MSEQLITWVDVEQELAQHYKAGHWPEALAWAETYWTGVRLHLRSLEAEGPVAAWLKEVFSARLKGEPGDLRLELDSHLLLPVGFEVVEGEDTQLHYIPSFARPMRVPGPKPRVDEDRNERFYDPPLVAFHSFKGGVGRTTHALAFALEVVNYTSGKVLLVDGDFEAPGLSWHIRDRYPEPEVSYADFLILAHGDDDPEAKEAISVVAKRIANQEDRGLYVLPSFREGFRWESLDVRPDDLLAGRSPFAVSELLVALGAKLGVKAVVVDLRAGLSELSAGLLLDACVFRVLATSLGVQALRGTVEIARRLRTVVGRRSSSTTVFVISHVPRELAESETVADARESLITALSDPNEALDEGEISEVVVSEYNLDLVTLPLAWDRAIEVVNKTGLPQRMRALVERSPITGAASSPVPEALSLADARRRLAKRAEQQIFAEAGEGTGFLRIEPLTRLAQDHRTRLPAAVVTGAKGAGKTYTFFQLILAKTWSSFIDHALGTSEDQRIAYIVPLIEPRNVVEAARERLKAAERALDVWFGIDRMDTGTLRDRLLEKIESQDVALTKWRDFWLDAMAWRLGCESGVAGAGDKLTEYLRTKELRATFVVDGLEDFFQDFQDSEIERLALRALLQEVPERLGRVGGEEVGVVTLVRPDLVYAAVSQNAQQFLARYKPYMIRWSHDAALKLAIWLAVQADVLEIEDGASAVADLAEGPRDEMLKKLWGNKLGSAKSREARSTAWVIGVLSDFEGQIQARDIVRLIHHAAERSVGRADRFDDRLLDPRAMREALEDWGVEKIRELSEEDKHLATIFEVLRAAPREKKHVPFKAKDLKLEDEHLEYLRRRGIIYDDGGDIYITELVRIGLGFEMGNGARPRIVSLRHKILRGS